MVELIGRIAGIALVALLASCGTGAVATSTTDAANPVASTTTTETRQVAATTTTGTGSNESGVSASVLPDFIGIWNQMAADLDRSEWMIESIPLMPPPASPDESFGTEASVGGDPPQVMISITATGAGVYALDVAILRLGPSEDLIADAFKIGVMAALNATPSPEVDALVAELVELAMKPEPDLTNTVELPGGLIGQAFSTDQVHVLSVQWPIG